MWENSKQIFEGGRGEEVRKKEDDEEDEDEDRYEVEERGRGEVADAL